MLKVEETKNWAQIVLKRNLQDNQRQENNQNYFLSRISLLAPWEARAQKKQLVKGVNIQDCPKTEICHDFVKYLIISIITDFSDMRQGHDRGLRNTGRSTSISS